MPLQILICVLAGAFGREMYAAPFDAAAKSTNEFGLQLYRQLATGDHNLCVSPYSISCALAMTLSGADGEARNEMARVLHLDGKRNSDESFAALQKSLGEIPIKTAEIAKGSKESGGPTEPITIAVANRLFPQSGYEFRKEFFARVKQYYGAAPEPLNYERNAATATKRINDWVAKQTRDKIRDLIPGTLDSRSRLVLANAIYLKASWADSFSESVTKPEPFHVNGGAAVNVPTMLGHRWDRYAKRAGYKIVTLSYIGEDLQLVIFLPDEINGLRSVEEKLDAAALADVAKLKSVEMILRLPKFKLEPATISLAEELQKLGMKRAFDIPAGSANFDGIAPRKPDDYLKISEVFHKTFIEVDEKGTEAAAATAVATMTTSGIESPRPKPLEVKIDRPFLYAIQHVPSGACLFLGRVTDPR